jgi:hypothetical protein
MKYHTTVAHGSTDVEEIKRLVSAVRTGEIDYESNDPRIGKLRALARTRTTQRNSETVLRGWGAGEFPVDKTRGHRRNRFHAG